MERIGPQLLLPAPQAPSRGRVKFTYDPDGRPVEDLVVTGSWDRQGNYSPDWKHSAIPLRRQQDGRWQADLEVSWQGSQKFQWTVQGRSGPQVFTDSPLEFAPKAGAQTRVEYAQRTLTRMGLVQAGNDARARFWAPAARQVWLVVGESRVPLEKDERGFWNGTASGRWNEFQGQSYGFEVNVDGRTSLRADPYARRLQGQLRGVGDLHLSSKDGQEVNKFYKVFAPPTEPVEEVTTNPHGPPPLPDPNAVDQAEPLAQAVAFRRFEVQQQSKADAVFLRLLDAQGEPLSRTHLERLLGQDGADLVHKFRPKSDIFWRDACQPDGRIALVKEGPDAWATIVNQPRALEGLRYRLEVEKDGRLLGDVNGDGRLSRAEARATPFNDAYSDQLVNINDQRLGIVTRSEFDWQHQPPKINPDKAVTYQLHVGSFLGSSGNTRRSTFKDLIEKLDYFKELGVNQLELLPTTAFEGQRDWGYIGTNTLAAAEQYGFVDQDGSWVHGDQALKRFIDAAHGKGLAVIDDVVYNHWGGDHNNLWEIDGKANSYLNWGNGMRQTPWGPLPAMNQGPVRQFVLDSAMSRLDEYRFDGIRFDFTHLIHDQKEGGGTAGWTLLRELTRQARAHHPGVFLAAEEFPNHESLTNPPAANGQGGAGFDAMWNTEFQHRLVHDAHNPSVLQQAVAGKETNMDKLMGHLVSHPGFSDATRSVTVISNHDEVGNADRTVNVAGDPPGGEPPNAWQKGAARLSFGVGMLSPGRPIFFQGEETLAQNTFRWGVPSTWDTDAPSPDGLCHREFCRAAIDLRHSSPAFDASVEARRIYTHNADSVMAFARQKDGQQYVVVASLNHKPLPGYQLPLDLGNYELVLNSDARNFGGDGIGRQRVAGGPQAKLDLPPAAVLVYRKAN
ncbi:alpha amylase C-terminal domain-containing protein [bacterium]|nr:alpha amylase C-terminal domain-containing protein [bacterium]